MGECTMTAKMTHRLEGFIFSAALILVMTLTKPAASTTILVPQHYKTINEAINWAKHGDEIVVAPAIYVENVNFTGKNIVLRSTNPTLPATVEATIIDGNQKGSVVTFAGSETGNAVLSGFTIRNGSASYGGGIRGNGATARIEYNTVTGNSAIRGGGLYWCEGTIQNNTITRNSASQLGGGIADCQGLIENNTISNNTSFWGGGLRNCSGTVQYNTVTGNRSTGGAGGGMHVCNGVIRNNTISNNRANTNGGGVYDCDGRIEENTISRNSAVRGGGMYWCDGSILNNVITSNSAEISGGGLYDCDAQIQNNTITRNTAGSSGGGLLYSTGTIVNCIIWNNFAPSFPQVSAGSIPTYCCIQGFVVGGQGNNGGDPLFRGPNDFHLQPWSPCIDSGNNTYCPTADKDGNLRPYDGNGDGRAVCDMGAYEYVGRPAFTSVQHGLWPLYE
jgi:hypothetical protein